MSKSKVTYPKSTIEAKYARLRSSQPAENRWFEEKDKSLARFSNAQLQFSPSGPVHSVHQIMLNELSNYEFSTQLAQEHPLEGHDDLILRILYHASLPEVIPADLEQSINLWVRLPPFLTSNPLSFADLALFDHKRFLTNPLDFLSPTFAEMVGSCRSASCQVYCFIPRTHQPLAHRR